MRIEDLSVNYHVDIAPDLFLELRIAANEEAAMKAIDEGRILSEFWIIDNRLEEKLMKHEEFLLNCAGLPFGTVFNGNLYRILKGYRKKGIPASRLDGGESEIRWLYYEKEFGAVISALKLWEHAYVHMKVAGIASCGARFCFDNTDKPLPLHIGDNSDCVFFLPVDSVNSWIEELDSFITDILEKRR